MEFLFFIFFRKYDSRSQAVLKSIFLTICINIKLHNVSKNAERHGGASRRPTTENDYKLSFAVASVLAFVDSTTKLSKN